MGGLSGSVVALAIVACSAVSIAAEPQGMAMRYTLDRDAQVSVIVTVDEPYGVAALTDGTVLDISKERR